MQPELNKNNSNLNEINTNKENTKAIQSPKNEN